MAAEFEPKDKLNKKLFNNPRKLENQLLVFATELFKLWDQKSYGKI